MSDGRKDGGEGDGGRVVYSRLPSAAEAERAASVLKREMETAVDLDVPLEVEVGTGTNWMDVKK